MAEFLIRRLETDDERPAFDCGDSDLNEYFEQDSRIGCKELMAVTYAVFRGERKVGFFCVSNDAIQRSNIPNRAKKKIPKAKRFSSLPAVKIGRLGVDKDFQKQGIGSSVLDYIKAWFTLGNKTGCRFIVVDAYRTAVPFYEKNGFDYLTAKDVNDDTRTMYFDLYQIAQSLHAAEL